MKKTIENLGSLFSSYSRLALGIFLCAATLSATACSDDDDNDSPEEVIVEADAVDVVEGTLVSQTYGLTESVADASQTAATNEVYAGKSALVCGQPYNSSFSASNSQATYSYAYSVQKSYQLNCTSSGLPQSFAYSHSMSGTYDAVRMSSNDGAEGAFTLTGLDASSATADLNGTYKRSGTQISKVRNQRTFNSNVLYNISNLKVNKSLHKIEGGTATLVIELSADGVTKSYNASITFTGNNSATLVINGNSYVIKW